MKKTVLQIIAHGAAGPDGRRSTNGPEVRALQSLDWHDRERFRFVVCYSKRGNLWDDFAKREDIELIDFSVYSKYQYSAIRELAGIIREKRVDVIHTQGPGSSDFFAAVVSRLTGVPLIVTKPVMLEDLSRTRLQKALYKVFDRFALASAAHVAAVSRAGLNQLMQVYGMRPGKASLVYNGVDTGRFAARIKEYEPAAPVVGTCGQFAPHKGWPDFLSAIRICREEFPGLKCLIVGDGPMREEIVSMAETMGLTGAVEFAGYRKDVRPFLGRMDIFMMASLSEGLPVAVIEAMASGLPVVATDVGGVSELVAHGETGLVSEAGNPQRLALHASMLLRDGRLMERFGGAGRRRVCESFTIQKMVAGYEELYRKV